MSSAFEDFAYRADEIAAGRDSVVSFPGLKTNDEAEAENEPGFFESEVASHKRRILALREAKRQIAAEESSGVELPDVITLDEWLEQADEPEAWRIDGLWPVGGRVNLSASPKAGKTTLITNVVRTLVDGDVFLGEYFSSGAPARESGPSVIVFDLEMTEGMLKDWYRKINLENRRQVSVIPLKGQGSALDFLTPETRKRLVEKYQGAHTYILDPVGPLLMALGMDENSNTDVQRFLTTWDEFVHEMGGKESMVANHAGWNGERARGASAFEGSGDSLWMLTNPERGDATPRFFRARGRDVSVAESQLVMDENKNLTLSGKSRKQVADEAKARAAVPVVLSVLEDGKVLSSNAIEAEVKRLKLEDGPGRDSVRAAVKLAYKQGRLVDRGTVKGGVSYGLPTGDLDGLL